MRKQYKPWHRLGAALTTGIIANVMGGAGLLVAGPAMAQSQMQANSATAQLESDDSSGGLIHGTINYLSDNTYIRMGPHYLDYTGSSGPLVVEDAQGLAAQSFGPGRSELDNTGAGLGDKSFVGGTIGVFIPGTGHHLAVEMLLAPPLELTFEVRGRAIDESLAATALNGVNGESIPTGVPATGKTIGTLMTLPPNVTIVYRPWVDTLIQPYIGAGVMYLYTYDTDVTNDVLTRASEPTLYLSKPLACIGQIGFDISLPHNFFLNADAKYVGCAEVETRLNGIQVISPTLSPTFGPVDVGTISSTVEFEAVIYSLSVGVHF